MTSAKPPVETCDRLIVGGPVITLDGMDRTFPHGAVAISGTTIAAVGEAAELQARFSPRETLRAEDCIVLPGSSIRTTTRR